MPHIQHVRSRPQEVLTAELQRAVQAPQSPLDNQLLASLPEAELDRLWPLMKSVDLPRGTSVHGAGEQQDQVYFPTAGIFVRRFETLSGATIGFGITGSEGAVGIASILGGDRMPSAELALTNARAYRVDAATLDLELERGGPLACALLRHVQLIIAEIGQDVACNRFHSVEQQLCRWLLSCLDRSTSNVLLMTHEMLGNLLGVRRESVTAAAHLLQMAGAFDCRRGRITIHNRALLEAQACECYANLKREQARLFPRDASTAHGVEAPETALGCARAR